MPPDAKHLQTYRRLRRHRNTAYLTIPREFLRTIRCEHRDWLKLTISPRGAIILTRADDLTAPDPTAAFAPY